MTSSTICKAAVIFDDLIPAYGTEWTPASIFNNEAGFKLAVNLSSSHT